MKKTALLLVFAILFGMIFGANVVSVSAADDDEEYEYTDQYDADGILAQYSTAEIVAMYPEFSAYLADELRALNTDISVREYEFSKQDIGAIFFSIVCENPDIFYVFPTNFEITAQVGTGKILSIRPEFFFDVEDIPARISTFNQKAEVFLAGVDMSWNDVTKARYLHDMLAQYVEYDTKYETITNTDYELYRTQMRIYTSYGAIVDNNAVCEGYAMAYKYLLSRVGVKAYYVQSVVKRHAWNIIQTNGNFYHVDITHDDPTYDNLGRVNHNNFFKSDNWFNNDGDAEHTSWITNLKATDTTYDNAWWNDVNTAIYRRDGYDYYVNQVYTSSIYAAVSRRNISTGATEVLKTLKTRWIVDGTTDTFWGRAFAYLTADGQYLYFNDTNSIYRMPFGGGTVETVYTKPSSNNYSIYGLSFKTNGSLYVTIKATPNAKDVIYKVNVSAQPYTEPPSTQDNTTETTEATEPTAATNSSGTTEPTEPYSDAPTEPQTEMTVATNQTAPTEVITAAPTEPEAVILPVIKKKITTFIKRSVSLTLTPKGAYKFTSADKTIATVTSKGIITTKKAGKVVITAKSSTAIFKLTLTVKNPRLNLTKKSIKKGRAFTLRVVGGSGRITYKSSNSRVAKINSKGRVVGKKKGKATITVTVCGMKFKCRVTVK